MVEPRPVEAPSQAEKRDVAATVPNSETNPSPALAAASSASVELTNLGQNVKLPPEATPTGNNNLPEVDWDKNFDLSPEEFIRADAAENEPLLTFEQAHALGILNLENLPAELLGPGNSAETPET